MWHKSSITASQGDDLEVIFLNNYEMVNYKNNFGRVYLTQLTQSNKKSTHLC